ncbi:MAG TPA: mechanosensitive ion channel domain-containing protein [Phycisphaerae bacterium]|nr:mechanosensitive ion channel domain-containing protein [Phycisphaerae bacterium]
MDRVLDWALGVWVTYSPALIAAILTLAIGWFVARMLKKLCRRVMTRAKVEATLVGFTTNLVYLGAMALVVISVLGKLGINTASFAAILAAAGLAVGFALQGSLSNFASGVLLIIFRPFKVGDYVEAGGIGGVVEDIQVFATKLRTPDNKAIIMPNSSITGGNITNYSAKDTRRVDLVFGIGYADDIEKAKRILADILAKDTRVLADPAVTIGVLELGDSSVNLAVRPWVKTGDYWDVFFEVTEAVKVQFDAQGISIPFPQRDVHLHQAA